MYSILKNTLKRNGALYAFLDTEQVWRYAMAAMRALTAARRCRGERATTAATARFAGAQRRQARSRIPLVNAQRS
jgi:hypothetical protein